MGKKHFLIENSELMKERDYDKNNEFALDPSKIYVSSYDKVYWICSKCGHRWCTCVRNRTRKGSGCPICAKEKRKKNWMKTIVKKNSLVLNSFLMSEWCFEKNKEENLYPENFSCFSNQKVWRKCKKCGSEYRMIIANKNIRKSSCPICSNKIVKADINSLEHTHPDLALEWDYEKNKIKPSEVSYGQGKKVWWKCPNGHSYQATILHRTNGKTNCPICNKGRQTSFAEQAIYFYIKQLFPNAINSYKDIFDNGMELDIYIPELNLGIEYDGYHWHGKDKYEREHQKYKICVNNDIRLIRIREGERIDYRFINADVEYYGFDILKKKDFEIKIKYLIDNLVSLYPEYKNEKMIINLDKDEMKIRKYMNKKVNSLASLYPEIAKEWDYDKNEGFTPQQITPGSSTSVFWKCSKCKHVWKTSVSHRVQGTGCPECSKKRRDFGGYAESKRIYQYSLAGVLIGEFESISEAGRYLKINTSNICMCAKHIRPNAGGFRWEYEKYDKLEPIIKEEKKCLLNRNGKPVLQLDDKGNVIRRYDSMSEAGRVLKKHSSGITRVLKGESKTFAGYFWKLDNDKN